MREHHVVLDSKATLEKFARPLRDLAANSDARSLVVDRETSSRLANALRAHVIRWPYLIHLTDFKTGLVIALDKNGEFCGAYKVPDLFTGEEAA